MPEFVREITAADVGKATFKARGITYRTCDFIGQVLPSDVGKRVYLVGDVLQVENDEQRDARLARLVKRYCRPWNAGLDSETPTVCRRLGRLLTALDTEITANIAEGDIVRELHEIRYHLCRRLEDDGWTMSYDGGNRLKIRPPGHKRPFPKRAAAASHVSIRIA